MKTGVLLERLLIGEPDKLSRLRPLAEFVGVSPQTIADWANRFPNDLTALRLPGGSVRISPRHLHDFLTKLNSGEISHE